MGEHETLEVRRVRHRPPIARGVKRIPDPDLAGAFDKTADEIVRDAAMYQDARAGKTLLAVVGEDRIKESNIGDVINVNIQTRSQIKNQITKVITSKH